MNPVHALKSYFSKTHFNIILTSTPSSYKWSLSFRFSYRNPVCIYLLSHTCHMHRQSQHPWFDKSFVVLVELLLIFATVSSQWWHYVFLKHCAVLLTVRSSIISGFKTTCHLLFKFRCFPGRSSIGLSSFLTSNHSVANFSFSLFSSMRERSRCCVALHNVQDDAGIKETLRLFRETIVAVDKQ